MQLDMLTPTGEARFSLIEIGTGIREYLNASLDIALSPYSSTRVEIKLINLAAAASE